MNIKIKSEEEIKAILAENNDFSVSFVPIMFSMCNKILFVSNNESYATLGHLKAGNWWWDKRWVEETNQNITLEKGTFIRIKPEFKHEFRGGFEIDRTIVQGVGEDGRLIFKNSCLMPKDFYVLEGWNGYGKFTNISVHYGATPWI